MPRLNIGGSVLYNDGSPVPDARVRIYDMDTGGNGNDRILDRGTNAQGAFSGLSKNWKDKNTVKIRVPFMPTITQEVPDVLMLRFRVDAGSHTHKGPFIHLGSNASAPIILPIAPPSATVTKAKRDLIHMISLAPQVSSDLRLFYETIEMASEVTTKAILGSFYRKIHIVKGSDATLAGLVAKLRSVSSRAGTQAVDLIMSPHGSNKSISFHDAASPIKDVRDEILTIPADCRKKFRTMFSTACYGASHLDGWIQSGFEAASGSNLIYADSLVSFPAFLSAWAAGRSFGDAVAAANASDIGDFQDERARAFFRLRGNDSFADKVDSHRQAKGDCDIKIVTRPF